MFRFYFFFFEKFSIRSIRFIVHNADAPILVRGWEKLSTYSIETYVYSFIQLDIVEVRKLPSLSYCKMKKMRVKEKKIARNYIAIGLNMQINETDKFVFSHPLDDGNNWKTSKSKLRQYDVE